MENYDSIEENFKITTKFEMNHEDNFIKKYVKEPITHYNEEDAVYYILILERNNYKFISFIEIGFDYPNR